MCLESSSFLPLANEKRAMHKKFSPKPISTTGFVNVDVSVFNEAILERRTHFLMIFLSIQKIRQNLQRKFQFVYFTLLS
jgi:hypothetical protein